jgi:hypothetical protein
MAAIAGASRAKLNAALANQGLELNQTASPSAVSATAISSPRKENVLPIIGVALSRTGDLHGR